MKKIILLSFVLASFLSEAQQTLPAGIATINDITIGSSANAFTVEGARSMLDFQPQINTVSFIHRADPSGGIGANSGEIYFDISKNGGTSWNINQGALYSDPSGNNAARYPEGVIYNPSGNTNPDNAFITFSVPLLANNSFSADASGTGNFAIPFSAMQTIHQHPYPDGTDLTVPDAMIITQQGKTFIADARLPNGSRQSYDNTLQLLQGTWNGSNDMNYTTNFLSIPVDHDNNGDALYAGKCGVAFAPDGVTGYAWINGHFDFNQAPDSAFNLGIRKTTDGGQTWNAVHYVTFISSGPATLYNLLAGTPTSKYSTWNESDGVVDKNGNLHIICAIAPITQAFTIDITPGKWGIFDVFTADGGLSYKAELLDKPQTFIAQFASLSGTITEYNRGQAASTWAGDKLFFGWMDTDTLLYGTYSNINPDIHIRALNKMTGLWTQSMNATMTSATASGACTFFNLAPYVSGNSGTYDLHCSYTEILSDIGSTVQHHYLQNIEVTDADFTVNPSTVDLNSFVVGLDETDASVLSSFSIYPNPASTQAEISFNLKKNNPVFLTIKNVMGQNIFASGEKLFDEGDHQIKLNLSDLAPDIYFVSILIGDQQAVKKLVISR